MLLTLLFLTFGITVESRSYYMTNCTVVVTCPDEIPEIVSCEKEYPDCKGWFMSGYTTSGVYTINPDKGTPFEVYCDMETDGGGWTVFQRRKDGSVDFFRNWNDYVEGFGDLTGEFWLGLSKMHRLTNSTDYTLRVDLEDFGNGNCYAKYSTFSIGDSTTDYTITVGGYSGDCGDSLTYHNGMRFSTTDRDNDLSSGSCAFTFSGAWWYNNCYHSNLNGFYREEYNSRNVVWYFSKDLYSLKSTEMKLRKN